MKRIISVVFLLLILYLVKYIKSSSKKTPGFYCNDPKISHNFNGDTIPWRILFISSLISTFLLITLSEIRILGLKQTTWKFILHWYVNFLVGTCLNLVTVEVMKTLIAEHRPHFLHTCRPNLLENCQDGEYVNDYVCKNDYYDDHFHRDSIKSFPSGHTSYSVYVGVFCSIYITHRLGVIKPFKSCVQLILQLLCVAWSLFCSLSRITDRRHHWWDVLSGSLIGILTVLFITKTLCKNFDTDRILWLKSADEINKICSKNH